MILYYVERDTSLLYEVQLFEKFVMLKPAGADIEKPVTRLPLRIFEKRFREFWGDPSLIYIEPEGSA